MVTDAPIGWVWLLPEGIAHPCANNALKTPKLRVWPPESPKGEGRRFDLRVGQGVDWGNGRLDLCHVSTFLDGYGSAYIVANGLKICLQTYQRQCIVYVYKEKFRNTLVTDVILRYKL